MAKALATESSRNFIAVYYDENNLFSELMNTRLSRTRLPGFLGLLGDVKVRLINSIV